MSKGGQPDHVQYPNFNSFKTQNCLVLQHPSLHSLKLRIEGVHEGTSHLTYTHITPSLTEIDQSGREYLRNERPTKTNQEHAGDRSQIIQLKNSHQWSASGLL